jgi:predicted  nucleic acid-binding Zn-ribbon protein
MCSIGVQKDRKVGNVVALLREIEEKLINGLQSEEKIQREEMKEEFDYKKAVEELEAIAAKVEDPSTGIGDIDKYMKRSQQLIEACRAYLRGAREALEAAEK